MRTFSSLPCYSFTVNQMMLEGDRHSYYLLQCLPTDLSFSWGMLRIEALKSADWMLGLISVW